MTPTSEAMAPPPGGSAAPRRKAYTVRISRPKLQRALALIIGVILVAHLSVHIYHYTVHPVSDLLFNAVDVDQEENFSTWYQGFSLLFASVLLFIVAARRRGDRDPLALYWQGLGIVFVMLSLDEIAGYHETLNAIMTESWTVPALVLVALFAIAYTRFLLRVERPTAKRFVAAGAVYMGGAVGMERFSEWFIKISVVTFRFPWGNLVIRHTNETMAKTLDYSIATAIEEGMEMLGVWLFIRAILLFMSAEDETVVPVTLARPAQSGAPRSGGPTPT